MVPGHHFTCFQRYYACLKSGGKGTVPRLVWVEIAKSQWLKDWQELSDGMTNSAAPTGLQIKANSRRGLGCSVRTWTDDTRVGAPDEVFSNLDAFSCKEQKH